ncbi:MAG: hypothetical protein WB037_14430, partial [Pseudolabrys sp.]
QQHAEVSDDRKFAVLHQHISERCAQLQVCKYGSLRKRREAAEPELLAEPEQGHDRFKTVKGQ